MTDPSEAYDERTHGALKALERYLDENLTYFAALSGKAAAEEAGLEEALGAAIDEIDLES